MDPNPTDLRDLIAQAQQGDSDALLRLYALHKKPIAGLAREHQCAGLDEDDMAQIGIAALIKAVKRFNPAKGALLWPFAEPQVRSDMIVASSRWQGLPDHVRSVYGKVKRTYARLQSENGLTPDAAELAQATGETTKTVGLLLAVWNGGPLSLEDRLLPREVARLAAHLPDPVKAVLDAAAIEEQAHTVHAALGGAEGDKEERVTCHWILTVLREADGYDFDWTDIAAMLNGGLPPEAYSSDKPAWEPTVDAEFPRLTAIPRTWAEVMQAFATWKRPLTAELLRQRYKRAYDQIRRFPRGDQG